MEADELFRARLKNFEKEPHPWPPSEDDDDGEDRSFWTIDRCPKHEECSPLAWSKCSHKNYGGEAKLRWSVADHLRASGKHSMSWKDAVQIAWSEQCVITQETETFEDRKRMREEHERWKEQQKMRRRYQ